MEQNTLTPDSTFPYRLFRFAHKRALDSVSVSYFAVVSKDNNPVGLILSIDIDERWHHARQAATNFWQIFVREFNHSESRSTLIRFEESLKELNKAVIKAQAKVKQTISVVAIVLEGNQIHFSTIGTSRIFLHRSGEINDVTTGSTRNGNQFAAVTSGDVDTNDTLLIANQNLYEFIASESDELWEDNDLNELSKKILGRTQNSEQALNCVILQYSPDETTQTTLYWEEGDKRYPIKFPKLSLPVLPKISLPKISFSKLSIIFNSIKKINFSQLKFHKLKKVKPVYLYMVAVIIAVAFGASALLNRQTNSSTDPLEETTVIDFTNTDGTKRLDFLFNLASTNKIIALSSDEITQLTVLARENNIEIVTPVGKISELPRSVVSISTHEGLLYLLDESGQLWQVGVNDQLKQIDHLIMVKNPTSLVAFSETSLVATDSLGNIWHYNGETTGPTSLVLPSNLSSNNKLIAQYLNNLYIYSESNNSVYRQTNFTDKITTNSPYTGLTSLGSSKIWSWTINGDFIFLTDRSDIVGLLRDKITINAIATPNSTAQSNISSEDDVIIISSKQLLSAYLPDGTLLWQKFYLTNEEITDVSVSGNTVWFSIGKEIYRQAI